jgi:hypothetical protein
MLKSIKGKTLEEISDPGLKGMWLRTFDETHNPRSHFVITPEGDQAGVRLTEKGVPAETGWGSLNEIGKAVDIYGNPSRANISNNLGKQHKVRNFYNNIIDPNNAAGHSTMDTHAVAAALMRPLSSKSREVAHNFGSNVLGEAGPKGSAVTGMGGTYGLYQEAYRRAAAQRGILPREMQSITWEAIRGLFPAKFKNNPENIKVINNIWNDYRNTSTKC